MAWRYIGETDRTMVWECDFFSDLNGGVMNNFAEYFQPFSPYELAPFEPKHLQKSYPQGYNHDIKIDADKQIVIRMPRQQVMVYGFGRQLKLTDFPIVEGFLGGEYDLPPGSYGVLDIVKKFNLEKKRPHKIRPSLYPGGGLPGGIDEMYVYGTTGFTLKPDRTTFIITPTEYKVRGYVFLTDDQWDFASDHGFAKVVNPFVQTLFGPSHYNVHPGGILIEYTGMGTFLEVKQRR